MKIAIDVMGADHSPTEQIAAAVEWQKEHDDILFLVGNDALIQTELGHYEYHPQRLVVVPAADVIDMDESPGTALRKKPNASIVVATGMVKKGLADALVSCGNTGAQLAAGIFGLGRLSGVERAPLLATFPTGKDRIISLVDVGANVDCKPKQLLQFAVLGTVFAKVILKKENPRVGLLNNGAEESKGNTTVQEAYQLLKNQQDINFIGNLEGRALFSDEADIVVCDGFVGNILLKSLEGFTMFMGKACYQEFGKPPAVLAGLDHSKIGGLPLLGIAGISVVCHGSSKREAIYNAIQAAVDSVNHQLVEMQQEALTQIH